ncbi:hypothetical protein MLD38_039306 [Melastoma candidum]|uniref:Uncharacterized protein n=1 Tax=Melastoma candidum TaxID=119954 RepID=A0ACB9L237_9MYRT|nr:hypothetical protein MLD38_039306 [Melastoma candidum]
MFEGLVRQVLIGYLGRYVKDIQKEQLKITLWNEEVLLENVELILEAFDYLRLPFALREGRVGRLSIRIPWKKLGWDPIIIVLEDVFVRASQREGEEWSAEAIKKREYAGKKAKLATAELAKLSRRVCDNQTGQYFLSYITAKILDNIQVSIRNFNVMYHAIMNDSRRDFEGDIVFGVKLNSLTILKQVSISTRGFVHKVVDVAGLEIYCNPFKDAEDAKYTKFAGFDEHLYRSMLEPLDVHISLAVNRSGKVDKDTPQCSFGVEISSLVINVNELQLEQLFLLSDDLFFSQLREKYGSHRPSLKSLSGNARNMAKIMWNYAQESVLSDVRRKLRKKSWRYFGQQLSSCRQYVNLYKKKLVFLQREQPVDDMVLDELEQLERDLDLEDILNYRSVAEYEIQELLPKSSNYDSKSTVEKSRNDRLGRPRGWLNWLSRGMLSAAGTEDSGQFSGIVSDEVIKDIYEATEFHPQSVAYGDTIASDKICKFLVKILIHQSSITFQNVGYGKKVAELLLLDTSFLCRLWEKSASAVVMTKTVRILNPQGDNIVLMGRDDLVQDAEDPSCSIEVDILPPEEISIKVIIQPLDMLFDYEFLLNCMSFFRILASFEFQHERVLSSLHGIKDPKARILTKAEYLLSSHKKVIWDVEVLEITLNIHGRDRFSECGKMIIRLGAIFVNSDFVAPESLASRSSSESALLCDILGPRYVQIFDNFEVKLDNIWVVLVKDSVSKPIKVLEKCSAFIKFASCRIQDELVPHQLKVSTTLSSVDVHISPFIHYSIMELVLYLQSAHQKFEETYLTRPNSDSKSSDYANNLDFGFSIGANLRTLNIHLDLESETKDQCKCILSMDGLAFRCNFAEFLECSFFSMGAKIIAYTFMDSSDGHILCSFGSEVVVPPMNQHGVQKLDAFEEDASKWSGACFSLHYEAPRDSNRCDNCVIVLKNGEIHCYPSIVGMFVEFFTRITDHGSPHTRTDPLFRNESNRSPWMETNFGYQHSQNFIGAKVFFDYFPFVRAPSSEDISGIETVLLNDDMPIRRSKIWSSVRDKYKPSSVQHPNVGDANFTFPGLKSFKAAIDLSFSGITMHFHESSRIIGTIVFPTFNSSVYIFDEVMDILCSSDGLVLTSSCCNPRLQEFLWGPSCNSCSPIIDMRLKIRNGQINSPVEVGIGIQHVCCVLPLEYLALLIGYFSLPEWTSMSSQQVAQNGSHEPNQSSFILKFEILDSVLILPVEDNSSYFLNLQMKQFLCCFIEGSLTSSSENDIPLECFIPENEVADQSHYLSIFGRELSLSLLLFMNEMDTQLLMENHARVGNIMLISPLSADFWIRIPPNNECLTENFKICTCVMGKIVNCTIIADDEYAFDGFEALRKVINQVISVVNECGDCQYNASDFSEAKKSEDECQVVLPVFSNIQLTEVRILMESLMVQFQHSSKGLTPPEPIARSEMQFMFTASLENDVIEELSCNFSSLALFTLPTPVILARFNGSSSTSSVFCVTLSKIVQGTDELSIVLPSLDIWLELSSWRNIINIIAESWAHMTKSNHPVISVGNSIYHSKLTEGACDGSPNFAADDVSPKQGALTILKVERFGATFHIPITMAHELENCCKNILVTVNSESTEMHFMDGRDIMKSNISRISLTLELIEEGNHRSWPFIQLYQINVDAEIQNRQLDTLNVNGELQCDFIDVRLTYQTLDFWHDIVVDFPEGGSSQIAVVGLNCKVQIRKASILLTDRRWDCSGPLMELLMRNFILHVAASKVFSQASVEGDLELNYNNINKVMWEPLLEPWRFQASMARKLDTSVLNTSTVTEICVESKMQLNLNITESVLELSFRAVEMIKDACGVSKQSDLAGSRKFLRPSYIENTSTERFAPYILQNLTSLPLHYCTFKGCSSYDEILLKEQKGWSLVKPGSSVEIYGDETPEEHLLRYRPAHSCDRLNKMQSSRVSHNFIIIQFDGISAPSVPMSIDLVGVCYFEVDFSKPSALGLAKTEYSQSHTNALAADITRTGSGFVVPVVFDVSIQRFSKLIRLYSTVLLFNGTSIPMELRFDIPLGLSPKITDPIYPGQSFPLPLHLAESGRIRWRPLGASYVWSEPHNVSSILAQESKIGILRSFVCYPSHPSNDPFRCCLSVMKLQLPSLQESNNVYDWLSRNSVKSLDERVKLSANPSRLTQQSIYQFTMSTPLIVHNFLPQPVILTIESGGVSRRTQLSEVATEFHHVDPSHELVIDLLIKPFKPLSSRFPSAEYFSALAKLNGAKYMLSETLSFDPGPFHVTMEKTMDAFSGAREIFISVPYLLYNCLGFPISISDSTDGVKLGVCIVPSCYEVVEEEAIHANEGLGLFSSSNASKVKGSPITSTQQMSDVAFVEKGIGGKLFGKGLISVGTQSLENGFGDNKVSPSGTNFKGPISPTRNSDAGVDEQERVKAYAYSPHPGVGEVARLFSISKYLPENVRRKVSNPLWSYPFPLVHPNGSSIVVMPQPVPNAAYIISVTSAVISEPFSGKTTAISFQPRYVISNACGKDLCYKQKGTDTIFHLGKGKHSHLHWTDSTRDLMVSICYDEPGWQWSGSFVPDNLGDTQVKIRNCASGSLNLIRVEVQNADGSISDEKVITSLQGGSGTHLILLSDDNTGYMPYRIENFSKERLRVHQQKCESFETTIYSYQSCSYTWDEPSYPHRLIVEVPGERALGSYALDFVMDTVTVCLPPTIEKPERTLLVSVRAEGATKVLSIVDSSYHICPPVLKRKIEPKQPVFSEYKEKISISVPFFGISIMNSEPQELLFACAKGITLELLQSMDKQKLSFTVLSMQIDNQLCASPYPVIMSFPNFHEINSSGCYEGPTADNLQDYSSNVSQTVVDLTVSKWRKTDPSLVSFECINLRMAEFQLEVEQEVLLGLYNFFKAGYVRWQDTVQPSFDPTSRPFLQEDLIRDPELHFSSSRKSNVSFPTVTPVGAPWQKIYHLARRERKIFVEVLDVGAVKFTLSFSSTPWMLRNGILATGETLVQRGLIALADIEGARIFLKQLNLLHHMTGWDSIQEILIRHYTRQLLHEMYKVLGSAGVIGNPLGFARSLGLGIRDFLSVPTKNFFDSPGGLIIGMAQGTGSLFSNTVYALSDAATQFSKAAQKGIVALTFNEQAAEKIGKHRRGESSQSEGVISEVLEGLTGLLESPIRGAEKHGLPGVLSGAALGLTRLVARPAASILEVTGKTAQSIRNRSRHLQVASRRHRTRLPRPLSKDLPLRPYSWEEAIGMSVLEEATDGMNFKEQVLVTCKVLKQGGTFVIVTERLVLVVSCSSLVDLGKPQFRGTPAYPEWVIESQLGLDSVIHVASSEDVVHIIGSCSDSSPRKNRQQLQISKGGERVPRWSGPQSFPLSQINLVLASKEDADQLLAILLSLIERGKERGWGSGSVLHRSSLR